MNQLLNKYAIVYGLKKFICFSQYTTQGQDIIFNCHHGPNECYGNKVHACALSHIQANSYQMEHTRESLTLDFINCMMKAGKNFPDNVYPGARCARENNINTWENIQQCANSSEGNQLLMRHGQATMNFQNPLLSVPTVVFADVCFELISFKFFIYFGFYFICRNTRRVSAIVPRMILLVYSAHMWLNPCLKCVPIAIQL